VPDSSWYYSTSAIHIIALRQLHCWNDVKCHVTLVYNLVYSFLADSSTAGKEAVAVSSAGDTHNVHTSPDELASAAAGMPLPRRRRDGTQRAAPANQDLLALQAVTDTALSHLTLDDLLAALLERITDILGVDNAAVLLLDQAGDMLSIQAVRGIEEPVASEVQVPLGQGFAGRIAATREPLVLDNIASYPVITSLLREQLHSMVGVPLVLGDQVLGVVHVGTMLPRHFTDRDVHLLQQVADRMALAIDRARLYQAEQRARAQLDAQVAQLEAVMEAVPYALAVYDTTGRIILANTTYSAHMPPGETVAERIRSAGGVFDLQGRQLSEAQWPQTRALRGEVLAGTRALVLALHPPLGEPIYSRVTAAPLRDREGGIIGAVTLNQNTTEQKRLEREQEEARSRELAAEQVAEQMSTFMATAAHDIRQPLTVAAARVQVAEHLAERLAAALADPPSKQGVMKQPPRQLADEAVESLQRAQASMDRLRRLVNLLFDVTQAQNQALVLDLASVDLRALVEEQVAAGQLAVTEHHIRVHVPDAVVLVQADADRLGEVLSNYLANALKYSPVDQPVTVQLDIVDDHSVVSVTDHGPGVPPEERSRIWEIFYRSPKVRVAPANRPREGSLGLGLHICKQIVELHPGGSVGLESEVGQGSTFWFRLPLVS
jgi:signal transduction histidine kinase/putative methionine-R-sulfoxide reductase with GAF domain